MVRTFGAATPEHGERLHAAKDASQALSMSTLWNVRVLEVAGDRARLAVTLAHPDAGRFPRSPQFALRLLFDEARGLDDKISDSAPASSPTALSLRSSIFEGSGCETAPSIEMCGVQRPRRTG